jgi:hypothetical protein
MEIVLLAANAPPVSNPIDLFCCLIFQASIFPHHLYEISSHISGTPFFRFGHATFGISDRTCTTQEGVIAEIRRGLVIAFLHKAVVSLNPDLWGF